VQISVAIEQAPPLAKQVLDAGSQHPVPRHVLPAQQAWVAFPHAVHVPPVQTWLPVQALPAATHVPAVGSQQPAVQVLPAQQVLPVAPHDTQLLPWQISSVPHASPLATH
jgi:hypothetical protein